MSGIRSSAEMSPLASMADAGAAYVAVLFLEIAQVFFDQLQHLALVAQDRFEFARSTRARRYIRLRCACVPAPPAVQAAFPGSRSPEVRSRWKLFCRFLRAASRERDSRMVVMIASRLSRAIFKPSRICARARALSSSNWVRRRITLWRYSM